MTLVNDPTSGFAYRLTRGRSRVDLDEFAGGIPQEMARLPEIRIGRRWFTTWQLLAVLVPLGLATLVASIMGARYLRTFAEVQSFIAHYPGVGDFARPVDSGYPWWLRFQHFLNLFFMLFIGRSGLQILADHPRLYLNGHCTPGTEWFRLRGPVPAEGVWTAKQDSVALPGWLGLPGVRHSIGLARWWHFSIDTLWLANGAIFVVLLFATDQWQRLVPVSFSVFPHALSTAIQYLSLDFPPASGWRQYDALQILAYFTTVFVAAPLAMLSGLLQAPFIAARFKTARGPLNRQIARTLHVGVLAYFVQFVAIHVTMVVLTGPVRNLNHITRGVDDQLLLGLLITASGLAIVAAAWMAATPFTLRYPRVVQHIGREITGPFRALFERVRPMAEYEEKDISPYFWPNGTLPIDQEYKQLRANEFAEYRLKVGGFVEMPCEFSLAELMALPNGLYQSLSRMQLTDH